MSLRSPLITIMTRAAEKAARSLKRDFGEVENLQVSRKGPSDFVSTADLKAEKIIREELARAHPDYGFHGEESGANSTDSNPVRWVVDPLDGTTNFLHGLPHFAVSIALEKNAAIVAGVVYDPIKDEMFYAEKGQGAFLNDRRLRVANRVRLDGTIAATGIPFNGHGDRAPFLRELNTVMAKTAGVRRWGAAALDLAYIAAGRYDSYWEHGLSPWDMAAGALIAAEAGATVTDLDGKPLDIWTAQSILSANIDLHPRMLKLFHDVRTR